MGNSAEKAKTDIPRRIVIEGAEPEIDAGRFAAKRIIGDQVIVEADIFTDGHDAIRAILLHRKADSREWSESPMEFLVNDRWRGIFTVAELGRYVFTIVAWVDRFDSWINGLRKKLAANQDVRVELLEGAGLIESAAQRAQDADRKRLTEWARRIAEETAPPAARAAIVLAPEVAELMRRHADRRGATQYEREVPIVVDPPRARFSSWYEFFPRSVWNGDEKLHGTLRDCIERLPYVARLGFDVLYLPPIHPIGISWRKGPNNTLHAGPEDPGSPWAIGAEEGGHKSVHPQLGTLEDLRALVRAAREHGIDVAMDIAFQCSPDHPYVKEHPEWFRWRPDGTVQYAENPPKKYQDIYPFDFETPAWRELYGELKNVFDFWIEQGVRVFRVDNPHTKPFPFWEQVITELKAEHPELIFLAEAFTRPKVMQRLAKLGYTQSYTYFSWRNTKWELTQYFTELTRTKVREFFRPNLWPNTPDILTEHLQTGGRSNFMARAVLAATLGANYGIYGPAFELLEHRPREYGSEEYLDSEKYQIRRWKLETPGNLSDYIARLNRIRRENAALQADRNLIFHKIDNDEMIAYSKHTEDLGNIVLTVVNLDPHHTHSGWLELPLHELGIEGERPFQAHDLISGARFLWHGAVNYVQLNPQESPAQIFLLRRRVRSERDFDYFM